MNPRPSVIVWLLVCLLQCRAQSSIGARIVQQEGGSEGSVASDSGQRVLDAGGVESVGLSSDGSVVTNFQRVRDATLLLPWICQHGEIVPGGLAPNAWPPLPSTVFTGNAITVPRSGQLRFTLRNASGARIDLAVMDDRTGRGGNVVGLHLFILRERGDLRTRSYMVGDTPMAYVSPGPFYGLLYTELVPVSREAGEVAQTIEIAPGHEHWSGPLRFRWSRVSRSEAELLLACSSGMRRVMVDLGR